MLLFVESFSFTRSSRFIVAPMKLDNNIYDCNDNDKDYYYYNRQIRIQLFMKKVRCARLAIDTDGTTIDDKKYNNISRHRKEYSATIDTSINNSKTTAVKTTSSTSPPISPDLHNWISNIEEPEEQKQESTGSSFHPFGSVFSSNKKKEETKNNTGSSQQYASISLSDQDDTTIMMITTIKNLRSIQYERSCHVLMIEIFFVCFDARVIISII